MKKRVVAFLLSMTLCSAMVVEAGAAAVGDFTAPVATEDVFSDSETSDQESTEETQPGNDPAENGTAGDVPADGTEGNDVIIGDSVEGPETPPDENLDDTITDDTADGNLTDDGTANDGADVPAGDVPGDDAGDGSADVPTDVPADVPAGDAAEPGVEFSDDVFTSGDELAAPMDVVVLQDDYAVMAAADFEKADEENATLLWSRWEKVNGKWMLQKLPVARAAAQAAVLAEDVPEEEVSAEADITSTEADAAENVNADVPESDPAEADVQPVSLEASAQEAAVYAAPVTEYYKNQLVTVTTVDDSGKTLETGSYYFDGNGYLVTGIKTVNKGTRGRSLDANTEFYFLEEKNTKIERQLGNEPKTIAPYNSNLGQMQRNYDWLWDGTRFHNFGPDGSAETIKDDIYTINGASYYLQSGKPYAKGVLYINAKKSYYAFSPEKNASGIPGQMIKNGWANRNVPKLGTQWMYFKGDGRYQAQKCGAYQIYPSSDARYLLSRGGYIQKNKMIKADNGYYYLSKSNGQVYADQIAKYGKYRYYFIKDGRRYTGRNRWIKANGNNGRYYYIGNVRGRIQEKRGIQKVTVNGKFVGWYLFSNGGNILQNYWSGGRYYLPDGRMASGVTKVGKNYYFFERSNSRTYRGKMYKGTWIKYNNKYYYASGKGILADNGWKNIRLGKTMYRFYFENCKAVTNRRMKDPKTNRYGWLDSRGKHVSGWIAMDNSRNRARYMNPSTGELYKNTVKTVGGRQYRFDKYGNRVNDRTSEFRQKSYYLECDRINGVMTVYTDNSKTIPIKTIRVSVGNPWTPTPKMRNERITRAGRWQLLMGPSWGQYGTHVRGGIYVHSVASGLMHGNNLPADDYRRLGNPASHGCIRCCVADAKWVWENCNGSKITIYDGKYNANECFKGPLGRNPLTPLRGSGTFDPTDPDYR